jgi:hypothetical protein
VFPDYYLGVSVLVAEFNRLCSLDYGRLALPYSMKTLAYYRFLPKEYLHPFSGCKECIFTYPIMDGGHLISSCYFFSFCYCLVVLYPYSFCVTRMGYYSLGVSNENKPTFASISRLWIAVRPTIMELMEPLQYCKY